MPSHHKPTETEIPRQINASVLPPPISPLRMQRRSSVSLFFENNVFIIPLKYLICDLFYDIILHINNPYNGEKESREE
jgi:hypothetical protein